MQHTYIPSKLYPLWGPYVGDLFTVITLAWVTVANQTTLTKYEAAVAKV
jgi:hypothetical protein